MDTKTRAEKIITDMDCDSCQVTVHMRRRMTKLIEDQLDEAVREAVEETKRDRDDVAQACKKISDKAVSDEYVEDGGYIKDWLYRDMYLAVCEITDNATREGFAAAREEGANRAWHACNDTDGDSDAVAKAVRAMEAEK